MIEDYKLLSDYHTIFKEKRFIVWGAGDKGKELGKSMYNHTEKVEFVDTDCTKWGNYCGMVVHSPDEILADKEKCAIVLSTDNLKVQNSILEQIKQMRLQELDIYTWYAVWSVLFFMDENSVSKSEYMSRVKKQNEIMEIKNKQRMLEQMITAQVVDKVVFVYQSKKVGSRAVALSADMAGVFGFHVHNFSFLEAKKNFIREMIKNISGKVISIVREPIARQISLLWQYWGTTGKDYFYLVRENLNSLESIENRFFSIPNGEDEFEWYLGEFKDILDINVYEYSFDRERGYSIIEKNGISLLLLKMEKLNDLEGVIKEFIGIDEFELIHANTAAGKKYKYAYENYLDNVKIPYHFYKHYYCNNKYVDHFYSEEEKKNFYKKWKEHIIGGKEG